MAEPGFVSQWRDRSGQGNDAVQYDPDLRPTLAQAGASGQPLVMFRPLPGRQGPHLRLRDAPTLRWGLDDFTLFLVASSTNVRPLAGVLFRKVFSPARSDGLQLLASSGRVSVMLRPGAVPYETIRDGLTDGTLFVLGVRRAAHTLELRVNGEPNGRATGPEVAIDLSAAAADAVLGAGADELPFCCQLQGGIAEVIAVKGPLADADLHRLEAYLEAKYPLR